MDTDTDQLRHTRPEIAHSPGNLTIHWYLMCNWQEFTVGENTFGERGVYLRYLTHFSQAADGFSLRRQPDNRCSPQRLESVARGQSKFVVPSSRCRLRPHVQVKYIDAFFSSDPTPIDTILGECRFGEAYFAAKKVRSLARTKANPE